MPPSSSKSHDPPDRSLSIIEWANIGACVLFSSQVLFAPKLWDLASPMDAPALNYLAIMQHYSKTLLALAAILYFVARQGGARLRRTVGYAMAISYATSLAIVTASQRPFQTAAQLLVNVGLLGFLAFFNFAIAVDL